MKNFEYSKKAQKGMRNLPNNIDIRVREKVHTYAENPELHRDWAKSVMGHDETYRLRIGNYRVLFKETDTLIFITKIGHRKDVYNNL